jgi:hypothetical protein
MKRPTVVAGLGAIVAALFTVLALFVASPPGGSYSVSDIANYAAKGHRPASFVALYLALIGIVGLLYMLSGLRELAGSSPRQRRAQEISWSAGLAAAAVLAVGWGVELVIPISGALGGAKPVPPPVGYEFTQAGTVLIWGGGFFLLGCSLIGFAVAATAAVPRWWRWIAVLAGVCGVLSIAFFPSFILALGLLVLGIGLVADRNVYSDSTPMTA